MAVLCLTVVFALAVHTLAEVRVTRPFGLHGRVRLPPEVVSNYSAAMLDYQRRLREAIAPDQRIGRWIAPTGFPWRWLAADGNAVQRIGDGLFRLTAGDCVNSICSDIDCAIDGWPVLACSDGRERRMASPDLSTVVLDGLTFRRTLPAAPPDDAPGPEARP